MPQEEIYGNRNGDYSAWHRRLSTRRFVGLEQAQLLAMIDIDASLWVEYDDGTKEPLALIETAVDDGQPWKPGTVTANLAKRADLPGYVVLYELSDRPNPASPDSRDIKGFRIRRLWPNPDSTWRKLTPKEYTDGLLELRKWQCARLDEEWKSSGFDPFDEAKRDS